MKDIKQMIKPIKTDNIEYDQNYYCKECPGKHKCNQSIVGYYEWKGKLVRCRYNLRGTYNTDRILNPKYNEFTCDNIDEIKNHINKHHSIYLHGSYGFGKTHFSYWCANQYNLKGHNVYVILSSELSQMLKEEISRSQTMGSYYKEKPLREKVKDVQILFLDDLGNEKMSEFVGEFISTIIDHRYIENKPTYITSNYTLEELHNKWEKPLGKHMTKQLLSRIKTFGVVQIKSTNWRK